jgi:HAD superfamily hydrolase (TIGR01490 family)
MRRTGKQSDGTSKIALAARPFVVDVDNGGLFVHTPARATLTCRPAGFPEPNRSGSSFLGSRTRTMSGVAQGAVVAATRARFTESRLPRSRPARTAPRSGRVTCRRAGSVSVRLVRASAADAEVPDGALAVGNLQADSAPRDLEPLVYRFEGDSATIVSARTGKLVGRNVKPDAKRFGAAVNNNAVSVPAKARTSAAAETDDASRGRVAPTVPGDASPAAVPVPAPLAEATRAQFAAETYAFAEDGSATVFAADGTKLRKHGASGGLASFLSPSPSPSASADEEEENATLAAESRATEVDAAASASSPRARIAETLPLITRNVTSNAVSLRRGVESAVSFVVNGAPKKPASARPVGRSAQAWIDAWAAGAPVTKLNAIKANRDVEDEKEKQDPDVSNESEDEPLPEVTTKAPPSFDLGDMDLAESTPGGAKRINVDPNERDYPDSVFVSDDEADQEAMEDVLGVKPKNYSLSDITNMAEKTSDAAKKTKTKRAAFFDLDGTVAKSNVVFQYVAWRMSTLNAFQKMLWVPFYAVKCVLYLIVDKVSRSKFNQMFALDFKGVVASDSAKREMAKISYESYLKKRVFPAALEAIGVLKAQGFQIVLVTGSLDFMIAPIVALIGADHVVANELETSTDEKTNEVVFTGKLNGAAVADDEKRLRILAYAALNDVDLSASRAYGDALADEAMLRTVGAPSVVSPKRDMRAKAEQEGWPILEWA